MTFLNKIFEHTNSKKGSQAKLLVLGSSGAGKTTLIRYLEKGKPVEEDIRTTLGIDYRTKPVRMDNWQFTLIDVGGQEIYQKIFWSLAISQADAVIYLFDGTITKNSSIFNNNLNQFEYMLNIVDDATPLLILINKQDLENCITAEEFITISGLNKLINRSMTFLQTSAKFGNGVEDAFHWLIEKMSLLEQ